MMHKWIVKNEVYVYIVLLKLFLELSIGNWEAQRRKGNNELKELKFVNGLAFGSPLKDCVTYER